MPDPTVVLSERFAAAIAAVSPDLAGADPVVRRSDHADYQANGAMALGKRTGRSPRAVAEEIIAEVDLAGVADGVELAGPGFINVRLADGFVASALTQMAASPTLGARTAAGADVEVAVVDYSAPNVAKEMHVGHLRSTIIGDAVVRILGFLGHKVIRRNHLGDWGTPFGMLIEHLADVGEAGTAADLSVGELGRFYTQAQAKFTAEEGFAARARARVVALQSGDPETLRLWRLLVDESSRYFTDVYRRLDVELTPDDNAGESSYNPMLAPVVAELRGRGLAVESDGAWCVFPPGFTTRDGDPLPLIVQKSDGGFGYDTTDLAAIRHRLCDLGATRLVYVVGAPQRDHFEMVFAAARLAGWLVPPARATHVGFGSVLGADGKMFRTRSGGVVRLIDLLDEAVNRASAIVAGKDPDLGPDERAAVAEAVGIGALKYADLSNDRVKDYVFDWDRMLDLAGNSAPYLQYAHARVRSIFRKAAAEGVDTGPPGPSAPAALTPPERALALELLSFDGAVTAAAEHLQPHRICTYLFALSGAFTSFYEQCPVLRADTDELRRSRLLLCDLTARTLAAGLGLLGIRAPERM